MYTFLSVLAPSLFPLLSFEERPGKFYNFSKICNSRLITSSLFLEEAKERQALCPGRYRLSTYFLVEALV